MSTVLTTIDSRVIQECSLQNPPSSFRSTRVGDSPWVLWAQVSTTLGDGVVVDIDVPESNIILVLQAIESVVWDIQASNATTIERVIATGFQQQQVVFSSRNNSTNTTSNSIVVEYYDTVVRNNSLQDIGCSGDCSVADMWYAIKKEFGYSPFSYDACSDNRLFLYETHGVAFAAPDIVANDNNSGDVLVLQDNVILEQQPTTTSSADTNYSYSIQSYRSTLQTSPAVLFAKRQSKHGASEFTNVTVDVDLPTSPSNYSSNNYSSRPIVLVLTDMGSAWWNINVSARTNLTHLIVAGRFGQRVTFLNDYNDNNHTNVQLMDHTSNRTERLLRCLFCTIAEADAWSRSTFGVPLFAFDYAEGATHFSYQQQQQQESIGGRSNGNSDAPTPGVVISPAPTTPGPTGTNRKASKGPTGQSSPSPTPTPLSSPPPTGTTRKASKGPTSSTTPAPTTTTVDAPVSPMPIRDKTSPGPTAAIANTARGGGNDNDANNSGNTAGRVFAGVGVFVGLVVILAGLWYLRKRRYHSATRVKEEVVLESQHVDKEIE